MQSHSVKGHIIWLSPVLSTPNNNTCKPRPPSQFNAIHSQPHRYACFAHVAGHLAPSLQLDVYNSGSYNDIESTDNCSI